MVEFLKELFSGNPPGPAVLVIDDELFFLAGASLALEQKGYRVFKAANGAEGLKIAFEKKPSLIILDITMPGLSGWEVLSTIRAAPSTKKTPVLMLTTVNATGDINKAFEMGANDYLIKPLNTERLFQKVATLLPGKPPPFKTK
ncbi:MAG: response regulator [Elusimicrobia bacterium]|nr:response regulator [Elusimicrobiota bacterium]